MGAHLDSNLPIVLVPLELLGVLLHDLRLLQRRHHLGHACDPCASALSARRSPSPIPVQALAAPASAFRLRLLRQSRAPHAGTQALGNRGVPARARSATLAPPRERPGERVAYVSWSVCTHLAQGARLHSFGKGRGRAGGRPKCRQGGVGYTSTSFPGSRLPRSPLASLIGIQKESWSSPRLHWADRFLAFLAHTPCASLLCARPAPLGRAASC